MEETIVTKARQQPLIKKAKPVLLKKLYEKHSEYIPEQS